jgi:hypothetical protein
VEFIIKKGGGSERFKPHFNRSLDKYYHTKDDYLGDLKKMNLEPYRGEQSNPSKKYEPSKWAREVTNEIQKRTDKNGNVELSGRLREEISKRSNLKSRDVSGLNPHRGGIN